MILSEDVCLQDAVVAKEYLTNHPKFVETAKNWTEAYASQAKQNEKVLLS